MNPPIVTPTGAHDPVANVPVTVIVNAPAVVPQAGATPVTVGGATGVYPLTSVPDAVPFPVPSVTTTFTADPAVRPPGTLTSTFVAVGAPWMVAATPPIVTPTGAHDPVANVPVTVIVNPPAVVPQPGETLVTVGAATGVKAAAFVAEPAAAVTTTSRALPTEVPVKVGILTRIVADAGVP